MYIINRFLTNYQDKPEFLGIFRAVIMEDLHKISVRISVLDASQGVALLAVDALGRSKGNTHPKSQDFVEVFGGLQTPFLPGLLLAYFRNKMSIL